jgi:hypothetical protein
VPADVYNVGRKEDGGSLEVVTRPGWLGEEWIVSLSWARPGLQTW